MDPRSITAQPEDSLTVYAVAGTPKHRCHCASEVRVSDPPFRKVYKVESRPSPTSFIFSAKAYYDILWIVLELDLGDIANNIANMAISKSKVDEAGS